MNRLNLLINLLILFLFVKADFAVGQDIAGNEGRTGGHPFLWILIPLTLVLLLVLAGWFFMLRRARKRALEQQERIREEIRKETEMRSEVMEPLTMPVPLVIEKENDGFPIVEPAIGFLRPRKNAIWLIGKFAIFDPKGKDITHLCSSKIKSLFYLILLRTLFDDGISSDELSDVLWPGMDKTRSKNNLSMTMNHLRKICEDMEGITLLHDKRSWKISYRDPLYIDLVDLYNKRNDLQGNAMAIIGLYSLGNLLHEDPIPEPDKYKGVFENEAVESLNYYANEFFEKQQYPLCYEIAGIIHNNFDELNENAFQFKLKALTRLRNYNKAKKEYDNFCQRFKLMMDIEFPVPFNKIAGID